MTKKPSFKDEAKSIIKPNKRLETLDDFFNEKVISEEFIE